MSVAILPHSRLQFTELLVDQGVEFWDLLDVPEIPQQNDDIQYMAQSSDRIDLLAYRFYGDPTLWWVIAVANDMELVPDDMHSGQVLRIPSPRYVLQELFQKSVHGGS